MDFLHMVVTLNCQHTVRDCKILACFLAVPTACIHAARLHVDTVYAHKDYGRANILFQKTPNGITIEIVDLNRMYIGPIDMKTGCKNFERLPATPQMHRWMAEEYAKARNFDVEKCFELMRAYRSVQPGKIDNLY